MSYIKYVDPFYGNFEPELPEPDETASKWFFLKAQVGNTLPAAARPFGMVSACAYTGGYPTGYGPYKSSSYSRPRRMMDKDSMTALGFSHFHQSGTGYIVEFYNWSIITPYSASVEPRLHRMPLSDERAAAGSYACFLGGTQCEVTVTDTSAIYRFTFMNEGGRVVFDPLLNGIFVDADTPLSPLGKVLSYETDGRSRVVSAVDFDKGFPIFTAVCCPQSVSAVQDDEGRTVFATAEKTAEVYAAFSFKSKERALQSLETAIDTGFAAAKKSSEELWDNALSRIRIDGDDEKKTKFYSNLYRCFVKPVILTDDSPFFDGACCCDLATMWDMSKTQLPLVFTLFPDTSSEIVNSFLNYFELYGYFPNECLLKRSEESTNNQARALTVNSIYDAFIRGVKNVDYRKALRYMVGELECEANAPFLEGRTVGEYPSQTLDLCVASHSIALLAQALGETELASKYFALAESWIMLYDKNTGVLCEEGRFYEGCNLNYSFRLLPDMQGRIDLAGGAEKFEASLDDFFGMTKPAAKQCLDPEDKMTMLIGQARCGFEGFNNETDMETPYNYCYIGKSEKTCRIVRSGEKYMFGSSGTGALPGNEDSGALSSLYVVNALGIFPVMGQNKIILGSPAVSGADITLANGSLLHIRVENFSDESITPKKLLWRGNELSSPFITVTELMQGGELRFVM